MREKNKQNMLREKGTVRNGLFSTKITWSTQKVEQSSERVLLGEKACNVRPAEILSVVSYVSSALFR